MRDKAARTPRLRRLANSGAANELSKNASTRCSLSSVSSASRNAAPCARLEIGFLHTPPNIIIPEKFIISQQADVHLVIAPMLTNPLASTNRPCYMKA